MVAEQVTIGYNIEQWGHDAIRATNSFVQFEISKVESNTSVESYGPQSIVQMQISIIRLGLVQNDDRTESVLNHNHRVFTTRTWIWCHFFCPVAKHDEDTQ